ncbi:hypothetical protein [Parasphingopyxis sp.]|uniref:hypothetical protein n=1 Tax=Parasphingopyxis sp. TaxID=1920299 RepID=UPI002628C9C5|nr:hypothetical protein [Parasphingopyxis sp.]
MPAASSSIERLLRLLPCPAQSAGLQSRISAANADTDANRTAADLKKGTTLARARSGLNALTFGPKTFIVGVTRNGRFERQAIPVILILIRTDDDLPSPALAFVIGYRISLFSSRDYVVGLCLIYCRPCRSGEQQTKRASDSRQCHDPGLSRAKHD